MLLGYHAGLSERGWAYEGSEYCLPCSCSAIVLESGTEQRVRFEMIPARYTVQLLCVKTRRKTMERQARTITLESTLKVFETAYCSRWP